MKNNLFLTSTTIKKSYNPLTDKGKEEMDDREFCQPEPETKLPDFEEERKKQLKEIESAYENGIKYFQLEDFKAAEQELVKVLKPVLSKLEAKSSYLDVGDYPEKILDAIYNLGKIYLKSINYHENFAKAAGIFQYCAGFAKKYKVGNAEEFLEQAYKVEEQFLASINLHSNYLKSKKAIIKHKQELQDIRKQSKEAVDKLENYKLEQVSEFAKEVEEIYNINTTFFVNNDIYKEMNLFQQILHDIDDKPSISVKMGLIQKLIAECQKQLEPPPCEHAVISLGSLAGGRMTPWSDLEFAIVIAKDKEEYKEYFRNLTKLLHIKVINFGETPLRSIGAELLNNFRTAKEEDDWFWDDILSNGFSFDGPDWHACKTPLGRQGGYKAVKTVINEMGVKETIIEDKPDFELILTPKQLANFQLEPDSDKDHNWFKSDIYLVQALRIVSLIAGKSSLLEQYKLNVSLIDKFETIRCRALQKLTVDINSFSLKLGNEEEGKLFNIKNDIFRLGDRIIDDLANYHIISLKSGQVSTMIWAMIDRMSHIKTFSLEGAQHLKEAISIATYLRLATYCHNEGQSESASTYEPTTASLSEEQKQTLIGKTFYIKDTQLLHHFYYVMLGLQKFMKIFCINEYKGFATIFMKNDHLFDDNDYNIAMVHARFLEYDKAIEYMEKALEENSQSQEVLEGLFFFYHKTGNVEKAKLVGHKIRYLAEESLKKETKNLLDLDTKSSNVKDIYHDEKEFNELTEIYKKTLKFDGKTLIITLKEQGPNYLDINVAASHNNLATSYCISGEYDKALEHCKKALEIDLKVHSYNIYHPDIATDYNNLGLAYYYKKDYENAIKYYNESLKIDLEIYKNNLNHPDIADTYLNFGLVFKDKEDYIESIEYYNKALNIYLIAYKNIPNHPKIAACYNNLGISYSYKGDYKSEIESHTKALEIKESFYKYNLNHYEVAVTYCNLGIAYMRDKKYSEAFKYSLKGYVIFKETLPENHLYITKSIHNLKIIHELLKYGNFDFNILVQAALSELPNHLGDNTLLYLVNAGVIPTPEGTTSLHIACCFSKAEAVKTIVEKGANVNAKTKANKTAIDIMIELLKQGDSKIEDFKNQLQIIEYLLAKGAKASNSKNADKLNQLLKGMIEFAKIMNPTFYKEISGNDQEESNDQSIFVVNSLNISGDLKDELDDYDI